MMIPAANIEELASFVKREGKDRVLFHSRVVWRLSFLLKTFLPELKQKI